MGKILDRIITNRLVEHLELGNGLSELQYGFRRGRSTQDALDNALKIIGENKKNQEFTCAVTLDIRNAFNSAHKSRIMEELIKLEVPRDLRNIISNFLSDRTIGLEDDHWSYNLGVPQGSSLGPILWLVIMEDLLSKANPSDKYHIQAFADDLLVLVRSPRVYKIAELAGEALTRCNDWASRNHLEFSIDKCQYTIFTPKGNITRRPTIKMGDDRIKYGHTIKYLGVTLDSNLTFSEHLDTVRERALKLLQKISRISRKTWGLKPEVIREIYFTVAERILLYGAAVWYTDYQRMNLKLRQIQRPFLLMITKCYRTVATDALCVLAGCLPLDIKARMESKKFKLLHKGEEVQVLNNSLGSDDCEVSKSEIIKVQDLFRSYWTYDMNARTQHSFYTDGSKMEGKVGSAFIYYHQNAKISEEKERLSDHATSYLAEVRAIQMAVNKARSMNILEYDVFTDSRSTLQALCALTSKGRVTDDLKHSIRISNSKVHFHWVKAHVGLTENEAVDQLAKEATELEVINTRYKLSKKQVKSVLFDEATKEWQESWDTSTKGRSVHKVYPLVSHKRLASDFLINQAITGHGSFGTYQARFHNLDDRCSCGQVQTVDHCIKSCGQWEEARRRLPPNFRDWSEKRIYADYYGRRFVKKIVQDLLDLRVPFGVASI